MSNNSFSFEGGEILQHIGATWFVSYAYYCRIDNSHRAWEKVETVSNRIYSYERSAEYHRKWLSEVLKMSPARLAKNKIGVRPEQTKEMARTLLGTF